MYVCMISYNQVCFLYAAIVDLSDEKGEIKHLQEHVDDYASSYLKGRESLILLEVKSKSF